MRALDTSRVGSLSWLLGLGVIATGLGTAINARLSSLLIDPIKHSRRTTSGPASFHSQR